MSILKGLARLLIHELPCSQIFSTPTW